MALHRLSRKKQTKIINNIDMTSLIDLTFLLLITFIITMPAIEQGISVRLPQAKSDVLPADKKPNTVSLDVTGKVFLNNTEILLDDLEQTLGVLAAEDPDVAVLIRGDERLDYGKIMDVVKILYKVKITRMALVTQTE
ncbi:MAG: biopolymer transporter ExbD [Kiritimatiellaeota bacterium]|nr:biopolymer transporter ExbD [Kiritimatiellota bacterium]